MGQYEPVMWNDIGPSEGLHAIAYSLLWATSSASAGGRTFTTRANAMRAIYIDEIGPSDGLHAIAYKLLYANASVSARGRIFITWANARDFLGSHFATGIMWAHTAFSCGSSLYARWANTSQLYGMKLAHPTACTRLLAGCCRLTRVYRPGAEHS